MTRLLLAQAAATLVLVGVIWFVQLVHYPLFARVGSAEFAAFEMAHRRRTSRLVAPVMLFEAAAAAALPFLPPAGISRVPTWLGLGLLGVIWSSTAFLQLPRHRILSRGFDPEVHRSLVASNWIRTGAWSLRGILVLWMAAAASQ